VRQEEWRRGWEGGGKENGMQGGGRGEGDAEKGGREEGMQFNRQGGSRTLTIVENPNNLYKTFHTGLPNSYNTFMTSLSPYRNMVCWVLKKFKFFVITFFFFHFSRLRLNDLLFVGVM
jgi:hypothetical protein